MSCILRRRRLTASGRDLDPIGYDWDAYEKSYRGGAFAFAG